MAKEVSTLSAKIRGKDIAEKIAGVMKDMLVKSGVRRLRNCVADSACTNAKARRTLWLDGLA